MSPNALLMTCTNFDLEAISDNDDQKEGGGSSGGGGESSEKEDDPDGEGKASKEGDLGDEEGDSEDAEGSSPSKEDGDSDEEGDSKDGASGDEGEDGDSDGEDDADSSDGDADGPKEGDSDEVNPSKGEDGDPARDLDPFRDLRDLLGHLQEEMESGETPDLLDNNEALGLKIDASHGEVKENEALWRPANPDLDQVIYPKASRADADVATSLLREGRAESSALQALLRSKFLRQRQPKAIHGVRKGQGLSSRRLVSTMVEIKTGARPSRPDVIREKAPDVSLATVLVIDQSSSMISRRRLAARSALVISSALDTVGSPSMTIGFRHNPYACEHTFTKGAHRHQAVVIDIFNDWHEPLRDTIGRFNHVQAVYYTPMSDGIQYGLQELNERPERHRVMIVLTDGEPDVSPVVRRQIRIAREAGITVVGVGIDAGCKAVAKLFDTYVVVPNTSELPRKLMETLTEIVFPSKAGKAVLDGRMRSSLTS